MHSIIFRLKPQTFGLRTGWIFSSRAKPIRFAVSCWHGEIYTHTGLWNKNTGAMTWWWMSHTKPFISAPMQQIVSANVGYNFRLISQTTMYPPDNWNSIVVCTVCCGPALSNWGCFAGILFGLCRVLNCGVYCLNCAGFRKKPVRIARWWL